MNCNTKDMNLLKVYSLTIDIPESADKFYQFTYVPFSSTLKSFDIKKYGFKLKSDNPTYVHIIFIYRNNTKLKY